MDNIKCNAIVLSSKDYKEKDKIITLFSPDRGKFNAVLKSVKIANAKLKFAAQPFCFGEFMLVEHCGMYTVSGCTLVESFYEITTDLNKYYVGGAILEATSAIVLPEQIESGLFIEILKALKNLAYSSINERIILIKFFLNIFSALGYKFSFTKCASCGCNFTVKRFLNLNNGEICCGQCHTYDSIEISPEVHSCFRIINSTEYDRLDSVKINIDVLTLTLKLAKLLFSLKFNYDLHTIKLLAD
ncbi:MAG: DNA repair protein RecO [Clostridia bacterium]|jgi:DNA repair protein RecO (recombination protein O)